MKIVVLCIGLLFSMNVFAEEGSYSLVKNPEMVKEKLKQASLKMNDISSDFVQEKHLEMLAVTIESKGKFWFKKENFLRWEYTEPFKYLVVVNDGKFSIKDNGKKNVFDINSNKAFQELNDIIVRSVNGTLVDSDKFDFELKENGELYFVTLHPKDETMKSVLSNIQLYFLKSDLSVHRVKMVESENDFTIITFSHKVLNQGIADSVFLVD